MSSEKQAQPYQWPNRLSEYGFCIALCMTQFLAEYLISGFALQLPLISEQQQSIGSDSQTSALWPASLLSLVMSAMLLICARLSDMFGGYWLFLFGTVWLSIWTFVPGFTQAMVVLNCARAMQGLALACCKSSGKNGNVLWWCWEDNGYRRHGKGAIAGKRPRNSPPLIFVVMPSTFAILEKLYASGRRKNAIIAIYSGFAPLGFFGGFTVAGSLPMGESQWYFHIGGILAGVTALVAWATIPRSVTLRRNTEVEMDWLGSFLIVTGVCRLEIVSLITFLTRWVVSADIYLTGLILLCYSLAVEPYADKNSNAAGFSQAIVLGPFIAGLACLVAAFYVEGWFAKCPLVPLDFFSPPSVKSFSLAAMCFYAGFGVWLYYSVDYFQAPAVTSDDLATHQTQLAIWYLPMGIVGLICCVAGEPILHSMPMTLLLFLVGLAWVAAPLILAAVPTPIGYWSTVFPSMLSATAGINFTFTISIVFLSSVQPPSYQGLCGAICSILLGLAFAFSLPIAQIVMTQASGSNWIMDSSAPLGSSEEADMLLGYRSAFLYATASAGVGLAACVLFVRIPTPARMGEKRRERRSTDGEAGGE